MNNSLLASLALAVVLASGAAMAQTTPPADVPGHPRINEVDQRLQNQQNRINNGVKDGQISAAQAAKDDTRDEKAAQKLSADEAKDGGHITRAQQNGLNGRLDVNSKHIHRQRTTTTPPPPAQ